MVDSGGSAEKSLDDCFANRSVTSRPCGLPTLEDSDKDDAGDYNELHDEGARGFDDVYIGCERSVGFQSCADSNDAWKMLDLDVKMPLVDTKMLEDDGDFHRMCSW